MTIKKRTVPASSGGSEGVTIADRFKLDMPQAEVKPVASKSATVAVIFALVALAVTGVLTYTLWKHWEFLMPA